MLDLSRVLAGPLCTMMLGDLGADVLKVERPRTGDETRAWGPPYDERGLAAYYLSINRNKLSIALDLDAPNDAALLRRLALEADIVVENFMPGTLERRSLGAGDMLAANPRLIWCTISGFGMQSSRPGYDFVAQAEAGWMSITGDPAGTPMKTGVAFSDVITGKDTAVTVLAALASRAMGTLGTSVDARRLHVSLLHSATAALGNVAQSVMVSGNDAIRWGNAHPNLCPYQLFPVAGGSLVIAVGTDAQWIACARAIGLDDLANDPVLKTNSGRVVERARVVEAFTTRLGTGDADHWLPILVAAGVPCGAVKTVREALSNVDASPSGGVHPLPPATVRFLPPLLDEHGALVKAQGWGAFSPS